MEWVFFKPVFRTVKDVLEQEAGTRKRFRPHKV